ncbi:L,D-transpeptidase family protein [Humisphaera borealis]|uniref:L,D-transpeptidase family protein n=1 Tax=Humisphaera borealis TaxID=2807512 RepID=A0A7M2WU16_9BACT|nr:L,D-transpeptidase family protein [Humisphaera borealis]QOV88764.1 L,D-transpeptidase family protein [Humisphaera borealis]
MPFISSRRFWTKVSRASAVVLLAVLLAGAFVYLQKTKPAGATDGANVAPVSPGGSGSASIVTGQTGQLVQPTAPKDSGSALPPLKPVNAKVPAKTDAAKADAGKAAAAKVTPPPQPGKAYVPPAPSAPIANADKVILDAKARLDAGDFVGVRALLNDGICNEQFKGVAADQARALQANANNQLLFTPTPVANDPYTQMAKIENSGSLRAIARQHAVSWELICRINNTTDRRIRVGQQLKTPFGPFHAVVWKQAYRMDLFLGGLPGEPGALYVTSLPVGLGKDDSTPTGLWTVVPGGKMKNPAWTNPRSGEHYEGYDPKNPLGGYWIALKGEEGNAVGKTSYGIHGTIEPDSIGKQASMGCVRLKVEDVQLVYDMMSDGKSRVLVRE